MTYVCLIKLKTGTVFMVEARSYMSPLDVNEEAIIAKETSLGMNLNSNTSEWRAERGLAP